MHAAEVVHALGRLVVVVGNSAALQLDCWHNKCLPQLDTDALAQLYSGFQLGQFDDATSAIRSIFPSPQP